MPNGELGSGERDADHWGTEPAFPGAGNYLNTLVTVVGEPVREKRISSDPENLGRFET